MSLEDIFWSLDKQSTKWSGYFDVYERHVGKFVGKSPRILEIGVLGGGSIEMWCKYFGEGTKTVGIDINEDCLKYKYEHDAKIVLGDQGDPAFWQRFFEEHTEPFDIIIDDGGHTMRQQMVTLNYCWPHLSEGGVLVVEDTHTSYWPAWGGGGSDSFLSYAQETTDLLNRQHYRNRREDFEDLYSVSFYNSQVVFEKRKIPEFKVVDNKEHTR